MLLISPPADIASGKTKGNMIHHANPNCVLDYIDVIFGDAMLENKLSLRTSSRSCGAFHGQSS